MRLKWCLRGALICHTGKKSANGKYSISNDYFTIVHIIIQLTDEKLSEPAILYIYWHNENELWKKKISNCLIKIPPGKRHEARVGAWVVLNFWANLRLAVLIEVVLIKKKACTISSFGCIAIITCVVEK